MEKRRERGGERTSEAPISHFYQFRPRYEHEHEHDEHSSSLTFCCCFSILLWLYFYFCSFFFDYYFIILKSFLANARTLPLIRYVRYMYVCDICYLRECVCVCWNVRSRKRSQGCHPPCTPSTYNIMYMPVCVCAAKKYCPLQLSSWTGSKNNAHSNGTPLITNSYACVGLPYLLILSNITALLKR